MPGRTGRRRSICRDRPTHVTQGVTNDRSMPATREANRSFIKEEPLVWSSMTNAQWVMQQSRTDLRCLSSRCGIAFCHGWLDDQPFTTRH